MEELQLRNKVYYTLGLISSSKLARQLQLRVDKSKAPKIGLACEGQLLKILGQLPDLELETRIYNGKIFQFISPAPVCDNLYDNINTGLAIFKQLNINISFSNNYQITCNFDLTKIYYR